VVAVVVAQSHQSLIGTRPSVAVNGHRRRQDCRSHRRYCCAALADRIEVPNYKSKAELLHYLRIAITMERTGFGID
jgi:hypothetical protein